MSSFYKLSVAIIAVATCFSLTSCNNVFYQVYGIESNLNQNDNSLVFENEDCKVMYNLWSENGSLSFIFMNKTDKDIFINMQKTFYIKNGAANDYFKNRTYESRTISSTSNGFSISQSYTTPSGLWTTRYNVPSTISSFTKIISGSSNGVSTQEPQYICVPARAYKAIDGFKIGIDVTYACNREKDFPHDNVVVATYDQSTSPLKFENRITYSFSEDSNGAKYINNSFWLSNIRNYAEKAAIESINEKKDCYSVNKTMHKQFKIGGPNKFYNTYNDKNIVE